MKKILLIGIIFLLLFGQHSLVGAADQNHVIINEIAWMGTQNSANDEWMELYNATESAIDISGWSLKSADNKLKIVLKGILLPHTFYLLERTDNTSIAEITADFIYKGSLTNSGLDLRLYDTSGNIIDAVFNSVKWAAGNNTTKQTMERTVLLGWQTSKSAGGTPRAQNSEGAIIYKAPAPLTKTSATLPKAKKSDTTVSVLGASLENSANSLSEEKYSQSPWFFFLIILALIIVLAIIVLLIKLNIFTWLNNFTKHI